MYQEIGVLVTPANDVDFQFENAAEKISQEPERLPGVFSVGLNVAINNTGGDGLRIRQDPGLNSPPLFLGREGEEFFIIAGPSLVDSLVWWRLESVSDQLRNGWAVQDYLQTIN